MARLFSYGTLRQAEVQMATFGRLLDGTEDALAGVALTPSRIDDPRIAQERGRTHNVNLAFDSGPESKVEGMVFELTDSELAVADAYEALDGYRRREVELVSGLRAWVYVDAGHKRDGD